MATVNQPLLGSPKATYPCCKTVFLTISVTVVLCLAALATLHVTTTNHFHICEKSKNPNSCHAILSSVATFEFLPPTKLLLLQAILKKSVPKINGAISTANDIHGRINDPKQQAGLADCATLMDLSRDRVEDSMLDLDSMSMNSLSGVHSWLSAVLTNHVTCSDGLHGPAKSIMETELKPLMELASTSLAIVNSMSPHSAGEITMPPTKEFPSWVTYKDRRVLQASPNAIKADVVVAQDGSGKYKTVQAAVTAAPDNSKTRYVIYVKKGTYKEKVDVGKTKKNIMIAGDGMDATIITGSLNFIDGTTTFNSATLAAVGDGFMAQDIWIQNTAGAQKHQAVALRVGADKSVINRCRIDGYQDTLYAHSLRQFYRDCSISGTVDFIFGDAAVVLQNCKLIANKPMSNQQNLVTAQGRTDPNQNTGTSIQNCQILASSDLSAVKSSIPTYLGRPWKEYSRTVVMQSNIGDHISPAGWLAWSGDFALKTLYYGEYMNNGLGAGTAQRVKWAGYRVITDANEARKFTVAQLIQGGAWLTSTGVTFY
ncbi:pectinesterase [Cinnamomum micranthum f. kanehirae]|uniref:Pectinesterase n=1 Tax=Cinnamomum micranthum f. kanehirae TaxID=337451 RepID=A0A3S3N494_9MAGN|nr:pectinesterase [Cinnamomum micranthum f. kanehirae]